MNIKRIYLDNYKWSEFVSRINEPEIYNLYHLVQNMTRSENLSFPISKSNYYFISKIKDYKFKNNLANIIMQLSLFNSFNSPNFLLNNLLLDKINLLLNKDLQKTLNKDLQNNIFNYSYMQKLDKEDKKLEFYRSFIRKNSNFVLSDLEIQLHPTTQAVMQVYSYEKDLLTISSNKTQELDFIDILFYYSQYLNNIEFDFADKNLDVEKIIKNKFQEFDFSKKDLDYIKNNLYKFLDINLLFNSQSFNTKLTDNQISELYYLYFASLYCDAIIIDESWNDIINNDLFKESLDKTTIVYNLEDLLEIILEDYAL